jgi:hypothetical protein
MEDADARVCGFAFGGIAAEEDHKSAKESVISIIL